MGNPGYIEPRPGGGFIEIFDDEGNGVLHATVIYADRGKLLPTPDRSASPAAPCSSS